jgi:hypothetical protein
LWEQWTREYGGKHDSAPVLCFTDIDAAYESVIAFFYMHSIGRHDEQNSLNLQLVLFHLKHKISPKSCQLQISLKRKMIFPQVFK